MFVLPCHPFNETKIVECIAQTRTEKEIKNFRLVSAVTHIDGVSRILRLTFLDAISNLHANGVDKPKSISERKERLQCEAI